MYDIIEKYGIEKVLNNLNLDFKYMVGNKDLSRPLYNLILKLSTILENVDIIFDNGKVITPNINESLLIDAFVDTFRTLPCDNGNFYIITDSFYVLVMPNFSSTDWVLE